MFCFLFVSQLVNQRDQEITHIAKSIEELAQIFKELAVLVIDQGTILDRIDYNMETAVEHAKEGVKQLEKAEEHQKNSVANKCIFVLILLIGIMVIVLIAKHGGFKKSKH
jgi:syntaxin 16